jgi:hypothetical protein
MPLKRAYSKSAISANVAELIRGGRDRAQAVAAAYNVAREAFRRRNPGKSLPAYLRQKS